MTVVVIRNIYMYQPQDTISYFVHMLNPPIPFHLREILDTYGYIDNNVHKCTSHLLLFAKKDNYDNLV